MSETATTPASTTPAATTPAATTPAATTPAATTPAATTPAATPPASTTVPDGTTPVATTPPAEQVKPEWLPDKFWDPKSGAKVEDIVKSYATLEAKLGQGKPAPPESPDKYALKPQDWPAEAEWNADAEKTLSEVYHKAGLTQEQAAAVTAHFIELEKAYTESGGGPVAAAVEQAIAKREADAVKAHNDAVVAGIKEVATEWGPQYDSKMTTIAGLAKSIGLDPKDPDIFGNIKVIRMLGRVTGLLGEAAQKTLAGTSVVNGFASGRDEANAIMRDTSHPDHAKWRAGDKAIAAKVSGLLRQG